MSSLSESELDDDWSDDVEKGDGEEEDEDSDEDRELPPGTAIFLFSLEPGTFP